MKLYELMIDHESCWGCRTCEVACKQENHAPEEIGFIKVLEAGPRIVNGQPEFMFRVGLCWHCDAPACAAACPETAIIQRDDGIVLLNEKKCIGCGLCVDACPYEAVEFDPDKDVACKCNLWSHRVDKGLLPACADNICPGHCISISAIPTRLRRRSRQSMPAAQKDPLRPQGTDF